MKIYTDTPEGVTVVKNAFIDQYMPQANGEFVKVYLYLLRCANTGRDLSLSSIADALEHTDKDIQRALSYWEKQDLIHIKAAPGGVIHSITFSDLPSASDEPEMRSVAFSDASAADTGRASGSYLNNSRSVAAETAVSGDSFYASENSRISRTETPGTSGKDSLSGAASTGTPLSSAASSRGVQGAGASAGTPAAPSRDRIAALAGQKDVRQIFFVAEQYLKRPLTSAEQEDFVYYYDTLKFSSDLIIYLLEYCISKGSFSRHYMRKVALGWAESGVTTVAQAKQESNLYNKNYFTILNTFGIKGRSPAGPEIEIMSRWFNEYDFTLDIIVEACNRTIRQIHQPSFEYANKILRQWNKNGVSSLDDVKRLDQIRTEEQQRRAEQKKADSQPAKSSGNRFNNFTQREYDYSQLEKQLLGHS
ncbi:MAG: DnaD domain protein [Lachnospiraceae bacterium]